MPFISSPIMESPEHIFKPVIEQIAFRLVATLDLIDVVKDNIYINTDFMSKTSTSNLAKDAIINVDALRVDAQIQLNPTSQKWDSYTFTHTISHGIYRTSFGDMTPIYYDGVNSVRVTELLTPATVQMNCVFHVRSANLAYRLPTQLRNIFGSGMVQYEDLFFDYPIPKPILHVIEGIRKQDRSIEPDTSLYDYIRVRTNNTWALNQNRVKTDTKEYIRQVRNLQSLLAVEYTDDRPNVVKTNDSAAEWEIPVVLTLQFGVPQLLLMHYPAVVGNKLLPSTYISEEDAQRDNRLVGNFHSSSLNRYMKLTANKHHYYPEPQVTHSPKYDEWLPPTDWRYHKYGHTTIATIGILLDENEELLTTLDMKQFSDEAFDLQRFVKMILMYEGKFATRPNSIITLSIFGNDRMLSWERDIDITDDLVIKFKGVDLHTQYRLVISVCRDLRYIDPTWHWILDHFKPHFDLSMQQAIDKAFHEGRIPGPFEIDGPPDIVEGGIDMCVIDKDGKDKQYDYPLGNIIDNDGVYHGNIFKPKPNAFAEGVLNKNGIHFESRVLNTNIIPQRSGIA